MNDMKKAFDKGRKRKTNPQTTVYERRRKKLIQQLDNASSQAERDEIIKQIKAIEHERFSVPYTDPFDDNFKRIQFVLFENIILV